MASLFTTLISMMSRKSTGVNKTPIKPILSLFFPSTSHFLLSIRVFSFQLNVAGSPGDGSTRYPFIFTCPCRNIFVFTILLMTKITKLSSTSKLMHCLNIQTNLHEQTIYLYEGPYPVKYWTKIHKQELRFPLQPLVHVKLWGTSPNNMDIY